MSYLLYKELDYRGSYIQEIIVHGYHAYRKAVKRTLQYGISTPTEGSRY